MMASAACAAASSLDSLDSVLDRIRRRSVTAEQIYKDWKLLRILWEAYHKGSDASFEIESEAKEIADDLTCFSDGKEDEYEGPESPFLLQLARDCETKTKRLMAEIGEALDHVYLSCSTHRGSTISNSIQLQFQLMSPATLDVSFWPRLVSHVQSNVLRISQIAVDYLGYEHFGVRDQVFTFYNSLKSIKRYIGLLLSDPKFPPLRGARATADDALPSIDACLGHVVSVLLRIANRCSDHWVDCKTGRIQVEKSELIKFVEDLHHEIHPRNPNFMRFHINFLLALCRSNSNDEEVDIVMQFCNYLFNSERGNFRKEVSSLVFIFVTTDTKLKDKDVVQSFFPEMNAVLEEMASLFEVNNHKGDKLDDSSQCSELLTRICLLRAELSLVVQIHNMNNISSNSSASSASMLSDWKDILTNLSIYSQNLSREKIEDGKKMLVFIESLFQEIETLHQSFSHKKITGPITKNSLLLLFFKIVIFKEELFLTDLLLLKSGNDTTSMARGKDQIALHLQKLEYFPLILSDERMKDREAMFRAFKPIEVFFRGLTCFASSFLITHGESDLSFVELLHKVNQLMKAKLEEIIPQFPLFAFPRTFKLEFLDSLLRNLVELRKHDPGSIASVKHHVEEIHQHLVSLRSFLSHVTEVEIEEFPELRDIGDRIVHLAYKMEYVIDSIEVEAQWQDFFWLTDVLEELRPLNEKTRGIHSTILDAKVRHPKNVTQSPLVTFPRDGTLANDKNMVDLRDQEEMIIGKLNSGMSQLDVVSIVGMPGLGKTTLARKVYESARVSLSFHVRAWCTVTPVYERRRLLLEILTCIDMQLLPADEILQMSDEDLELRLYRNLLGKRYLIVMDGVWEVRAWEALKNSFPDEANGSRILVTTCLRGVALEISPASEPHALRALSEDESMTLLEMKLFHEDGWTKELRVVGREIARKCRGLPLALVAVAGILKMRGKSHNSWKEIAGTLSSEILNDQDLQAQAVLELSYKHLPEYLKPCFLYLGVLDEEKDILVGKLIRLWLAEDLIPKTWTKSFEDVAEDFLMELIDRSLVVISKRSSNGKVKACRLQSFMLEFCKSKTKDANFFQLVTSCDDPYSSFPKSDHGFEFDFYHHLRPVSFTSYRLAISLKQNHFLESRPSGLGTRSLVFFASADSEKRWTYNISFILHNFKLLRVLDFECIDVASFPVEIGLLVQLRYLAVGGHVTPIPESIGKLRKLQTLIVKGLRGKIILPNTFWLLKCLRHLHVNVHLAFNLDEEELENCFVLEDLVSLSRISLPCGQDAERILKRFPNLRKLSCIFYESLDSSTTYNQYPALDFLTHLISLKIFYFGTPLKDGQFNFPLNLKKLTLSDFHLPCGHISAIGRLSNLQILKLQSCTFEEQIWDMEDEEFQELTFLSLDTLDIVEWIASPENLPSLETLVFQSCNDLKEMPLNFGEIPTLGMVEVNCCSPSVETWANKIKSEALEWGGEIKVLIRSSELKTRSP